MTKSCQGGKTAGNLSNISYATDKDPEGAERDEGSGGSGRGLA